MKSILIIFLILNSFNIFKSEKLNYQLVFEYLYSDIKDIFDLELFSRPKTNGLDFGDDIFYSGKIEKIENFPINKLVNYTKEDLNKNIKEKEKQKNLRKDKKQNEENIFDKLKKINEEYLKEEKTKQNKEETNNERKQRHHNFEFDNLFDDFFFDEPFIRMIFDNDFNQYNNFINRKYKPEQNEKNKEIQDNSKQTPNLYQKPLIKVIHPENGNNFPIIRIIKYPNSNNDFDLNNIIKSMESEFNNMYRLRVLSDKENPENKITKQKIFLPDEHNIVYFSNKFYFNYIKYLPKSTIILTKKQFAKELENYEDHYIFTIDDGISLTNALSRSENNYYKVKIGQNFEDTNLILISLSITVGICIFASVIYYYLLKRYNEENILPVQNLISKFPQYLCLLNIMMYFSFICSYNDSDGYFMVIKFVSMFLYSLFKSIFICILILLLSGWMTLSFIGWAKKLNTVIPIICFEIVTSVAFEIIGFYDVIAYNKMQLYYFRDILENIIIIGFSLFSINKYYIPLNNKCKYLSLINSDFNDSYNLKKKKMKLFSIFGIMYGLISIFADYLEFGLINKYLQNNNLHVIREIIFISIFNLVLLLLLLPKELPYLFTEETDLVKCEYLLGDLKEKSILDINNSQLKTIKKQLEKNENVQVILVNPFFGNKEQFDEFEGLHIGNATLSL